MKHPLLFMLIICCTIAMGCVLVAQTSSDYKLEPDIVEINRIKTLSENAESFEEFSINSKYEFIIISLNESDAGKILYGTLNVPQMSYNERLNEAIKNFDTIIDYRRGENLSGKIIIYTGKLANEGYNLRLIGIIIPIGIMLVLLGLYYFYMRYYLYAPFKRLKNFARSIATGNFDAPLPMDKDNLFGEFSESFDIMREELKEARERAIKAEKSKNELIATLSHDIKTPISIIRVASELLELNERNQKKLVNIKAIQNKTLEMDALISNLFSSALGDLEQLKVEVCDVRSEELSSLIAEADSLSKVTYVNSVPNCLVKADTLRLSQIFGNIISNSYKYANTKIEVAYGINNGRLQISFKDFGNTLKSEDLPLLSNKFYRGKNSEGKQGAGLGLYICKSLLNIMGAGIDYNLDKSGFIVNIYLALS